MGTYGHVLTELMIDAAVEMAYKTLHLSVVSASDRRHGQTVRFNFERRGLVNWKLASVSLP